MVKIIIALEILNLYLLNVDFSDFQISILDAPDIHFNMSKDRELNEKLYMLEMLHT